MCHHRPTGPRAVALVLALGLTAPAALAQGYFKDVPPTHWAYPAVNELARLGILKGYPAAPAPRRNAAPPPAPQRPAAPKRARRGAKARKQPRSQSRTRVQS